MDQARKTFLIRRGVPLYHAQLEARAIDAWRSAEELVCERWMQFLAARGDTRQGAFAAYVTALDAEAAAAAELELTQLGQAA